MTIILEHERRLAELRDSQTRLCATLSQQWRHEMDQVEAPAEPTALTPGVELVLREAAERCDEAKGLLLARVEAETARIAAGILNRIPGSNVSQGSAAAMDRVRADAAPAELSSHALVMVEFVALVAAADAVAKRAS